MCKRCGADAWYRKAERAYTCAPCANMRTRKWRSLNIEKSRATIRAWHSAHPDRNRSSQFRRKYGISLSEYSEMFQIQGGCCAICGNPEIVPDNTSTGNIRRMAVDHDHETGRVRGLLCNACNLALGKFKDSYDLLESALHYLERYRAKEAPIC